MDRRAIKPPLQTIQISTVPVKRHPDTVTIPPSLNLRETATPPSQQGQCGSCWAITTTQVLEDRLRRLPAEVPRLSHQFVSDCAKSCVSYNNRQGCARSCDGGFLVTGLAFLQKVGTPSAAFYPNRHRDGNGLEHLVRKLSSEQHQCPQAIPANEPLYKVSSYYTLTLYPDMFGITNAREPARPRTSAELAANALNIQREIFLHGPVCLCYNLFSDFTAFWDHPRAASMVYELGWALPRHERATIDPVGDVRWTQTSGPHGIHFITGHSISLVGWGTDPEHGEYWIARNSWGLDAPDGGFFRIRRGINCSAVEGDVCGMVPIPPLQSAGAIIPAINQTPPPLALLLVLVVGVCIGLSFVRPGSYATS
jgi:hypothetical protein